MNGADGKQKQQSQHYVSSFSMVIKPPSSTHRTGGNGWQGASTTRSPGANGVASKGMAGGGKADVFDRGTANGQVCRFSYHI